MEVEIDLVLASELGVAPHKLAPPISHRPDLNRPRVTDLLCSAETPLVLVEAGAGYGKTTASRQLADQAEAPVGWLSLDLDDDDPIAFVRALACSRLGSEPDATELLSTLRQRQVGMERRAIRELTGLMRAADRAVCLIIEDVHTIAVPDRPRHLRLLPRLGAGRVARGAHEQDCRRASAPPGACSVVRSPRWAPTTSRSPMRNRSPSSEPPFRTSMSRTWTSCPGRCGVGRPDSSSQSSRSRPVPAGSGWPGPACLGAAHRGLPDPGVPARPSRRRTDLPPALVGPRAPLRRDGRLRPRTDPFDGAATTAGEVGQRLRHVAAPVAA